MVLFKRKPVQFLQPPPIENDHEVWYIPQTGEVFVTYEDYLNRLDFYKQKRFICQITGHSGLNFFEALESELAGALEVEQAFPEPLKGPILRRVQFQTISRIDNLVDKLYEEFKGDFYPGEHVTVSIHTGERFTGVVRDKARFGSKMLPDGTLTVPFSRYFVSLDDSEDHEAVVDDNNIWRDRKVFTKSVLRSFVKKTVTRDAWTGAPWLVKDTIAAQFKIDTRIPTHLRYETKVQERKQAQSQKRLSSQMSHPQEAHGMANSFQNQGPVRLPELKPATRPPKASKNHNHHGHNGQVVKKPEPGQFVHLPLPGNPFQFPLSFRHNQVPPPPPAYTQPEPPPPPPPPKYPIEDLKVEPTHLVRPPIRYLCSDPPVEVAEPSPSCDNILMKSVGPLLETWDTLNVYCEIFQLDSFTFDDFLEAMQIASEETKVQLFDEIHCAVLKVLVDSEADGGRINFRLPDIESDEESDEDDEEEEEEDESREPTPQPTARATRSSMAKLEADRLAAEAAAAEREERQLENAPKHRAEELLADYDWIDHLRKRDFKDGGWETIMVGLLYQLSKEERRKAACEDLLIQLVPRDVEATQDTIRQHYAAMDVNYRAQALQIICLLTAETKAIRGYMEDCSEHMTGFRKDKIEWQRQRKQAIEELKALNEERKILLPENLPPSPAHEAADANGDVKMDDVDELTPAEDEAADMEEEPPRSVARGLRRGQDRAAERQRQKEREEEKRKEAEAAKAVPKQSKQFVKVLKEIQKKEDLIKKCEEEIAVIDNDLREADCARTRVLGKDRFWNRYYWFERNGMPYGGLPNSSTADAGYANGCIWIQGPDDLEREGYIDLAPEWQKEYQAIFNMTVPERKAKEEGLTSVFTARQWGYIDDPKDVKKLIDWLDPRGFNELKLRKELVNFSDRILKHMENRQAYLAASEAEAKAAEEEKEKEAKTNGATGKRMTTRTRNAVTPEPTPQYLCLQWENTTAFEELGYLHSDQPAPAPPKGKKGGSRKKEAAEEPAPAVKTRSRRK